MAASHPLAVAEAETKMINNNVEDVDELIPNKNMYHKTRATVTNLLDAALMISNMSSIAGIYKRRRSFVNTAEVFILMGALILSLVCQVTAAMSFMIIKYSENEQHKAKTNSQRFTKKRRHKNFAKITSYICVFLVMVLNMFIGIFSNVWDVSLDNPESYQYGLPMDNNTNG